MARIAGILLGALALLVAGFVALNWAPDRPVDELKARWAQPPSAFIELNGMQVHVRDEGPRDDPVPVVLLHGTSASLHTWDGWVRALEGGRRVIRVDMPGFGLTGPTPDGDYSIEAYTRFAISVLDHFGLRRCVLGGNSFGGWVAWETALAQPGRVAALVLVDSAGYAIKSQSVPIGFRIAKIPVLNRIMDVTLPRSLVESSVRNVYGDPSKVTPELVDRYYEITLRAGNRAALVQRFLQAPLGVDERRIREVKVPTLILWGGRDGLIPVEYGGLFNRDIAGSRLVVFDDLGHVPQEEDPARTVAAVKEFLEPD
ncbi:MAG: alpha/beta hydrolase [Gammaproteobacteria bacterium]|nr:alpha/beta hydrolase [Gammaproteobacteria bacterium]